MAMDITDFMMDDEDDDFVDYQNARAYLSEPEFTEEEERVASSVV